MVNFEPQQLESGFIHHHNECYRYWEWMAPSIAISQKFTVEWFGWIMIDPLYLYVDSYSPVAIPLIIFIVQKLFQPDWFTIYMIKLSIPNFY